MSRILLLGLLSGFGLSCLLARGKLRNYLRKRDSKRRGMTAEDKVIARMHQLIAERPEVGSPDHEFLKNWAYGNAGLEDERITEEQVEKVLRERLA